MKLNITKLLLGGIVLGALFLRTVNLGNNPPAISWDEASIGYNAYTILTTGRDEHGTFLPLDAFAAFGDYKPPLPIYLTVPFVALFGLNEIAVRLPSAIAGTLTVWVMYLLVLEFFHKSKQAGVIGLITAGLLAITPWHIMLSRAGFEANIALLFIVSGAWMVLKARVNPTYFLYCWLPFVAGIYTFNSTRYAGPLVAVGITVYIRDFIRKKQFAYGLLIAVIALIPIAPHLISRESRLRFEEVSIFTDLRTILISNTRRGVDGFAWWSDVLHNRRIGYAREYLIHFFDNLEPRFLFVKGDGNPKFSIQDTGQLLLVSAPFLVIGALSLFRDNPGIAWLFVWWLVASIAPTAVARETPHALRIENSLPVFILFTAYGLFMSVANIRTNRVRIFLFTIYCLLFTFNFLYFWHTYMTHYPKEYSGEWQYGYKQAIEFTEKHYDD
ncbi:MAG TPA: glycosyltransferase family 39 protein, partial [Patescibacteria group bacterium]|nr:glycosyltransferase family 39 protein [Patescibacteria group bacterium]